ncbi:hypothetical protein AZI86_09165 [Bdellovibrio bacteriovorus]|uniref:Uncharacterized protein n=1 Tax=Bdellovibrio bacteriovorus TaxID=959 RepID=A0A150WSC2_BDEBC|nr:hypothetical protein [Bdellovibrio bacteriovorus]KYG67169.1 hypothetical protein AZI86_09165 [Bdellovibrio bacteriovorus]
MKNFIAAVLLLVSFNAQADLAGTFKKIQNTYKGPFSLNYMQGTLGRVPIRESEVAPGVFQFQSAFRNDMARELATQNDFYVGNLFTTNYYELMGKYVYGNQYGSYVLNHGALLAAAPQASAQTASIVRHWVLERHYVTFFPNNKHAASFTLRGVSGAEFEQEYAYYFFNFALTAVTEDFQFLPLFVLAKSSPIADASSLERARTMIANLYDSMKMQYGDQDSAVKALYQLRNTIHNQISPDVINQINTYLNNYPRYASSTRGTLTQIQDILRAYFNVGPKRITDLAKKVGATNVQVAAEGLAKNGFSSQGGLALSQALAEIRTALSTNGIAADKKTDALLLLSSASQYLNKELSNLKVLETKLPVQAVVNLLYVEGFLIKDNWDYFSSEVAASASPAAAVAMIPDLADIANDTLNQAFQPALDQWVSLEPKMQYFIDNTIKSSALNTASLIAKKVK